MWSWLYKKQRNKEIYLPFAREWENSNDAPPKKNHIGQAMVKFFLLCGDCNLYKAVTLQVGMGKEFYSVLEPLCLMQT